jgi:hypothetical protein
MCLQTIRNHTFSSLADLVNPTVLVTSVSLSLSPLQGLFQSMQPEKNTAMVWVMVSVRKMCEV